MLTDDEDDDPGLDILQGIGADANREMFDRVVEGYQRQMLDKLASPHSPITSSSEEGSSSESSSEDDEEVGEMGTFAAPKPKMRRRSTIAQMAQMLGNSLHISIDEEKKVALISQIFKYVT